MSATAAGARRWAPLALAGALLAGCPINQRLLRLHEEGKFSEAIAAAKEWAAEEPGNASPWWWLGQSYYGNKQYQDAIGALTKSIALDKEPPYYLNLTSKSLAYCYAYTEQWEAAAEAFKRVVAQEPSNGIEYYNLGQSYAHLKRFDEGIAAFERALALGQTGDAREQIEGLRQGKARQAEARTPIREQPREAQTPEPRAVPIASGKLAVLDLKNFTKELTRENAQYFTDVVRSAALQRLRGVQVMTRENLLVLLQASGKTLEQCEGECEVETGRLIGADAIVSGEIQRLGRLYKLTLRLHDTHQGRLLSTAQASGASIEELDPNAQKAAGELFAAR